MALAGKRVPSGLMTGGAPCRKCLPEKPQPEQTQGSADTGIQTGLGLEKEHTGKPRLFKGSHRFHLVRVGCDWLIWDLFRDWFNLAAY